MPLVVQALRASITLLVASRRSLSIHRGGSGGGGGCRQTMASVQKSLDAFFTKRSVRSKATTCRDADAPVEAVTEPAVAGTEDAASVPAAVVGAAVGTDVAAAAAAATAAAGGMQQAQLTEQQRMRTGAKRNAALAKQVNFSILSNHAVVHILAVHVA